jgi:hypothetical protein
MRSGISLAALAADLGVVRTCPRHEQAYGLPDVLRSLTSDYCRQPGV